MLSARHCMILTNNPLVTECLPQQYRMMFRDSSAREILVEVRDLIYRGYRLYTHPLCGSVKPNESPYKSVAVSRRAQQMDEEEARIIGEAIALFDRFPFREEKRNLRAERDFQLIDYSLLCSGLDIDAAAGLSNRQV